MKRCEVCGRPADVHHIIHRSEGGLDFDMNYKFLCAEHHRGKKGPHKNPTADISYKIELQNKLEQTFIKKYYNVEEIAALLGMNYNAVKRLVKNFKRCKEGYRSSDVIYRLMGNRKYEEYMIDNFYYRELSISKVINL